MKARGVYVDEMCVGGWARCQGGAVCSVGVVAGFYEWGLGTATARSVRVVGEYVGGSRVGVGVGEDEARRRGAARAGWLRAKENARVRKKRSEARARIVARFGLALYLAGISGGGELRGREKRMYPRKNKLFKNRSSERQTLVLDGRGEEGDDDADGGEAEDGENVAAEVALLGGEGEEVEDGGGRGGEGHGCCCAGGAGGDDGAGGDGGSARGEGRGEGGRGEGEHLGVVGRAGGESGRVGGRLEGRGWERREDG